MAFETPQFLPAVPEIFLLLMACVLLVVDLFIKQEDREISYAIALFALLGTLILTLCCGTTGSQITFSGTFVNDQMAVVLKAFILGITAAVFLYSRRYLEERGLFRGEYYVLGLTSVLGMMIMVSAHNFITIYLGLELLSLSLYALVAFDRDSASASEAAMKYFVLGAIASGMLLYGMSMVYGISGSLDIAEVGQYLRSVDEYSIALIFGLCFVIVGLGFKLGAVPFHMWLPDVYQGAPTSVTALIGTAPKIAAFAMIMRLLVEGLGGMVADWQDMLIILAVLSMAIGNVVAIAQTNIKRMLAYSTIAHVGFILLGVLAGTRTGYSAAMFYTLVYSLMALGAFGMILLLSRKGFEAENIDDFRGLNERYPWYAFIMLLLMFSMAGVPPTVGFYAKFAVLQAVVQADIIWIAVYAVLMSIIGAFYYLRIVKVMYFDKPDHADHPVSEGWGVNAVISANGLLMLLLGLFPGALMALCAAAVTG